MLEAVKGSGDITAAVTRTLLLLSEDFPSILSLSDQKEMELAGAIETALAQALRPPIQVRPLP